MSTKPNQPTSSNPGQKTPDQKTTDQTPRTNTPVTPGGDRAHPSSIAPAPKSDSGTKPTTNVPKHSDNDDPRRLEVEAGKQSREGGSKKPS